MLNTFGKLEACLDERKPEAYATAWSKLARYARLAATR